MTFSKLRQKTEFLKGRTRRHQLPIAGPVARVTNLFRFRLQHRDHLDLAGFDILKKGRLAFQFFGKHVERVNLPVSVDPSRSAAERTISSTRDSRSRVRGRSDEPGEEAGEERS
jgi:hypothetical protein